MVIDYPYTIFYSKPRVIQLIDCLDYKNLSLMKEVKRISICNVPVDSLTMDETVALIDQSIRRKENLHHVVVNAAKLVNAQKDPELKASIVECDIINADGQSIVWAAKFLKEYLPERVAGIDLMDNLVALAARENYKIFFLEPKKML